MSAFRPDEIGDWSALKLEIIKEYAGHYSRILANQRNPALEHSYIDGFAGLGVHTLKETGEYVEGSPLNALRVTPPFKRYHLIDMDGQRVEFLRKRTAQDARVVVHEGDCNRILLEDVFPTVSFENYQRALCILDPYNMNPDWAVVERAGKSGAIEIFLNFMIMDMNMNVLQHNRSKVKKAQLERMNRFWGDESWQKVAYRPTTGMLPGLDLEHKVSNEQFVEAYRERLMNVAGFKFVPKPYPMMNKMGATIYYLFFASQNETGGRIVSGIFKKHREKGGL